LKVASANEAAETTIEFLDRAIREMDDAGNSEKPQDDHGPEGDSDDDDVDDNEDDEDDEDSEMSGNYKKKLRLSISNDEDENEE
jgi:hypothetical protein